MAKYLIIFGIVAFTTIATANPWFSWGYPPQSASGDECTIAIIFGWATSDGRPLMWKNRDVSNWHQEFHHYDLQPYSFTAVNYPFVQYEAEAYGGVNEVGFGIMNANALNFTDPPGYDDDGIIMYHSLLTCETVEDFLGYMDTTAYIGRTRPAIYGVFDAYGDAGMLEASQYDNYWYGADSTVDGVMVRSNFAYSGGNYSSTLQFRHDQALEFIQGAVAGDSLNIRFLFDVVARDLRTEEVDPYPLPYQGFYLHGTDTLWHCVRDHTAINREISQSAFVVQGIGEGENPLTATIWAMCGEPEMTPALPLWVAAGSVPAAMEGDVNGGPICLRARQLFDYLYYPFPDPYDDIIDTYKLMNDSGEGILVEIRGLESGYFDYVEARVEEWRVSFPSVEEIAGLQDSLASYVFQKMMEPSLVDDLILQFNDEGDLQLYWSPVVTSVITDSIIVDGYVIYFGGGYSGGALGDSLGFTTDTTFIPPISTIPASAFYQVRALWDNELSGD